MDFFYTIIALLTAGVSLITGLINLFTGLHKDGEKVDVVFGIMALCMFLFFLWPPVGFIQEDQAPYSFEVLITRIFNFSFIGLFPWFVLLYTGRRNKMIPAVLDGLVLLCYITMIFTKAESAQPLWALLVLLVLALNLIYGFYAGFAQIRKGDRQGGHWFIFAMVFFAVFYILTAIGQLGNDLSARVLGTKLFFPINLFPLSFMIIMGIRLRTNVYEKYRLEKILRWRDKQWDTLVENIQLLIIEFDFTGRIKYLNPYAVKALGYNSYAELAGKNWFDTCASREESTQHKFFFHDAREEGKLLPHVVGRAVSKNGNDLIINWTNVFVYDDDSKISSIMSIGLNITEQVNAFEEIKALRTELEKENLVLKDEQLPEENGPGIIGQSEALIYALQKARQVATTSATVLLEGETGVGKELFANLIHKCSYRSKKSFVKVNCAALPPELIESELFGHERGSFTGALQARKGRFELANGGTVFLDEVGELPLALQSKLLRVLQNGEFERIGGQQTIKVDVRVISATNKNLLNEVNNGRFREDLYYRLNVFPITIPALRNRKEDIDLLVRHFVKKFSVVYGKPIENISRADMGRIREYSWPGNIRELINVIERSIISSEGPTLKLDWQENIPEAPMVPSFLMEEVERAHMVKVLTDCNWKINGEDGAAIRLGLNPSTLRSRMKKLHISRSEA